MLLSVSGTAQAGSVKVVSPQAEADWEQMGLTDPVLQLYAAAGGAFFARTKGGLQRSDDGGVTWREVLLPPDGHEPVAVDPTNHLAIYAAGQGGLCKTEDDAATWCLVLP